jgi:hypothetical protein
VKSPFSHVVRLCDVVKTAQVSSQVVFCLESLASTGLVLLVRFGLV